ncbi:zinc finger CCCH domain-containing protein 37 isoform X2 [Malania oleifera]|uniref:zinc finger CCCH domain-containing protein 37 isoform X2 n=1 Tax=Malania oleifera TaxID=397392 RepID=UPI0025ADBBB1|nr:zinc finger CCCH domain-containing protein 37 isoform X2 [Malania oleifera]
MANPLYGYNPSYGGPGAANLSTLYSSRSITDPYLPDSLLSSSRYLTASDRLSSDPSAYSSADRASLFLSQKDSLRFSSAGEIAGAGVGSAGGILAAAAARISAAAAAAPAAASLVSRAAWSTADAGAAVDPVVASLKRSNEALYHQTVLGAHSMIGQSEAWFSNNSLAKRPRFESASNLPIYPQRPGEKDCAHYMLTRTCKFGDSCKFDHPIWVPEGGIPDWKEVPLVAISEFLPERPGEPDCPYFLKTQKCKFGLRCKFNHPKDQLVSSGTTEDASGTSLPERPFEPPCAFYMKTGNCKFGGTCKFHHPKDIQIPSAGQENGTGEQTLSMNVDGMRGDAMPVKPLVVTPALMHNSKGLPIRPGYKMFLLRNRKGEVDCPFYMKTGSCKYGTSCRYNHPDRSAAINPPAAAIGHAILASPATNLNIGVANPAGSILQTMDPRIAQMTLGLGPTIYPQRPGQIECDFYMKTGECKFGERCKFHHPIDRSAPTPSMMKIAEQENVTLTLAGLPRREGVIICPFYLKTGTCKFGATCKFDHPPPGEVMARATSQEASMSSGEGEGRRDA